ncbi:MAG: Hsp70 family protein, partial [Rhodoferax sp.]|uniref:Hsp70 family protein n=1 Tax=Rhodoferax sp. TaxID=50421 RepID=UPI003265BF4D
MSAPAQACGIDFGTSNSTAGWSRPGQGALLALEDDKLTLPSVVFFHAEDEHVSYGRAALADYLAGDEGRLMRSLKSLLGTRMIDEHTEVAGRALPFRSLLAQFIGELKRRAEQAAGQPFTRAVLGRPVFFVDDDPTADQEAEATLAGIAAAVGLREVAFQYEPIAAAFDYESQITREELVLVVDIGGGTSDFALVRLAPGRMHRAERRDDILASGGVHIGGTDFDKYLSLASVMPMLGMGSRLQSGLELPSAQYFNLATWHTINQAYTRSAWAQISDLRRDALDKDKLGRLQNLVRERAGHWLAMQVETAKIALSELPVTAMDLGRIAPGETLELHRDAADREKMERLQSLVRERAGHWLALQVEDAKIALSNADAAHIDIGRISAGETVNLHREELDRSIDGLVNTVEQTVARLLADAGITAAGID